LPFVQFCYRAASPQKPFTRLASAKKEKEKEKEYRIGMQPLSLQVYGILL